MKINVLSFAQAVEERQDDERAVKSQREKASEKLEKI
jgi:hypothetical protein